MRLIVLMALFLFVACKPTQVSEASTPPELPALKIEPTKCKQIHNTGVPIFVYECDFGGQICYFSWSSWGTEHFQMQCVG